ncbi:MAG TPA: transporter associated domain-containing protein [Bacillota bacterium]|nr:transporter associated domain-containing protein [Bacillota bacterium]
MKISRIKHKLINVTLYLENILAMIITVAIIIGIADLAKYIVMIFQTSAIETYDIFQRFLGHTLLLVVGVEMVAMLVRHTPGSVIEVLLYAVARKMLISNERMLEFLLGIVAIASIFAIKKYLFVSNIRDSEAINIFPASASITDINNSIGVKIPEDLADTVGGLISRLSKQSCRDIHEGSYYRIADAELKVLSFSDGVIHRVWAAKYNE